MGYLSRGHPNFGLLIQLKVQAQLKKKWIAATSNSVIAKSFTLAGKDSLSFQFTPPLQCSYLTVIEMIIDCDRGHPNMDVVDR